MAEGRAAAPGRRPRTTRTSNLIRTECSLSRQNRCIYVQSMLSRVGAAVLASQRPEIYDGSEKALYEECAVSPAVLWSRWACLHGMRVCPNLGGRFGFLCLADGLLLAPLFLVYSSASSASWPPAQPSTWARVWSLIARASGDLESEIAWQACLGFLRQSRPARDPQAVCTCVYVPIRSDMRRCEQTTRKRSVEAIQQVSRRNRRGNRRKQPLVTMQCTKTKAIRSKGE